MESMMTARQVAELLGVHENWVYDRAATGELPSYKIGGTRRFDPHRDRLLHRRAPRARAQAARAPCNQGQEAQPAEADETAGRPAA